MSRDRDVGWLAGMIEADGFICMSSSPQRNGRTRFQIIVGVSNTDPRILDRCRAVAGVGHIVWGKPRRDPRYPGRQRRAPGHWIAWSQRAATVLRVVAPALVAKAEQCALALQAQALIMPSRYSSNPNSQELGRLKAEISALNPRGRGSAAAWENAVLPARGASQLPLGV
jgi:hypothetical protein